jgi:hypothetical protein
MYELVFIFRVEIKNYIWNTGTIRCFDCSEGSPAGRSVSYYTELHKTEERTYSSKPKPKAEFKPAIFVLKQWNLLMK